jgi:hypothetical protein
MTARPRTVEKSAVQREVIAALSAAGDMRAAGMLQRCVEVRLSRRHGSGWPATCRNAGCVWCGPATARRWWRGIERWITGDDAAVSLAVLPLGPGRGVLRRAVARLRRAVRDVRDRAARRDRRWRGVAVAGMASADGTALLLIRHPGVGRAEVADALCRRWPGAVVGDAGSLSPSWEMPVEDAVELARARRGVEPLRVVVLAQRGANADPERQHAAAPPRVVEPMPVAL